MICGYTQCSFFWRQLQDGDCPCAASCPGYKEISDDNKQNSGLLEDE
jgi:hypothetical protein